MARGGKRERAGRKTTWESGVKFEETSPVRVPNYIKDKVLEVAHKLDAGEDIDFVSNSKNQQLQELESKLLLVESENEQLSKQLEKVYLDLETESKKLQLKIQELEQENYRLQGELNNSQPTIDNNSADWELVKQSIHDFRKRLVRLQPIQAVPEANNFLLNLEKKFETEKLSIDTTAVSTDKLDKPVGEIVTKSGIVETKIVTKPETHTQLGLLDINIEENSINNKPLTSVELSKRFNKNEGYVKAKKNYYKDRILEFELMLKTSDPDGIGWRYDQKDKKYHPIINVQDLEVENGV